jgi:hypothetical protein
MPLPKDLEPPRQGPPSKEMPKGPITYDKVTRQLKAGKGGALLSRIGSIFGGKDKK